MRKRPSTPWHNADIVAAVRKAGTSLRRLSVENEFAPSTLRAALHRRHPKAQALIAATIGQSRHAIWPHWYDAADRLRPLTPFKKHTSDDVKGFLELLAQEFNSTKGGEKGNITLYSFDGLMKVQVQIQDRMEFGPELQRAKVIVDECVREWSADSRVEIRAIVGRAFNVDKAGKINASELISLTRLDITDARWQEGMRAIREAQRPMSSKEYVRFYRRPSTTEDWAAITIDLAAA